MCFILQNFPAELLSKFAKIHPFTVLCKVKSCNSRAILLDEVKRGFIAKSTHQNLISNYFLSEEKKKSVFIAATIASYMTYGQGLSVFIHSYHNMIEIAV